MKTVRVGFIGVGSIAEHHIKLVQQVEDAVVSAVFDVNAERANYIASTYGAEVFTDSAELINSGKVDALFICTPPFAREGFVEQATAKGIPLFIEKPAARNLEDAERYLELIRKSGVINSSGYCLRYRPGVQKAKQYLQGKQVNLVMAYRINPTPPLTWFPNESLSGGQMLDQTTHQIDLVRYVAGEIQELRSIYAQRSIRDSHPEATIPDVGVVEFKMNSGAIGTIVNSCVSRHFSKGDVEIIGPDYYVGILGDTLIIRDDEQKFEETYTTNFYLEQDRSFIEAVRTGNQNLILCDYAEAVETLKVTLGANTSAETGQTVIIG